ncbi:hypothetical protein QBC42DRAFT_300114 [Cladorrhinum samala]|uniref:Uncharacterized protein n=1 Tax=Cladorrhinum samala TaxID=585594 RepID=A0AAV9HER1_9PEZI|nr:hypothetical protein QBC42DRAFT_300114 [Cladorrhinum samala]
MASSEPPVVHHRDGREKKPRQPVNQTATLGDKPKLVIGREREAESRPYYERGPSPARPERILVSRKNARRDDEKDWDDGRDNLRRRFIAADQRRNRDMATPRQSTERSRSVSPSERLQDFGSAQSPAHFVKPGDDDPHDVTVHMSLPVQDDPEGVLEECAKLRRLGHFRDAIGLFEDQLACFMKNGYVLLQYALCLFEAGEYGRLASLTPPGPPLSNHSQGPIPHRDPLNLALELLRCRAEIDSVDNIVYESLKDAAEAFVRRSWPAIDSTEARLLVLVASKAYDLISGLPDWDVMYRHLVDKGMVWEFRDILQELAQTSYVEGVLYRLIGKQTAPLSAAPVVVDPLDHICKQWDTDSDDDSTAFALLDIFTNLALMYKEVPFTAARVDKCADLANRYAQRLIALDESNSLARPYLRWTMAKILIKEDYPKKFEDSALFRGFRQGNLKVPRFTFPAQLLPVYVPVGDETPVWQPNTALDRSCAPIIRTVMKAAEELGDVEMQAACLRELMYRGDEEPESVVKKLKTLWKSAGNMHMIRIMHLFSYMLAQTPSARKRLRQDISTHGTIWRQRSLHAAQRMILAALESDDREKSKYRYQAAFINDRTCYRVPEEEWGHRDDNRMPLGHLFPMQPPPPPPPPTESPPPSPVGSLGRYSQPLRTRAQSPVGFPHVQKRNGVENRPPAPRTRSPERIEGRNESRAGSLPDFLRSPAWRPRERRATEPEKPSSSTRTSAKRELGNILKDISSIQTDIEKAQEANDRLRVSYLKARLARLEAEKNDKLAWEEEEEEEISTTSSIISNTTEAMTVILPDTGSSADDEEEEREEEDSDPVPQRTARVEDSAETPTELGMAAGESPALLPTDEDNDVPYDNMKLFITVLALMTSTVLAIPTPGSLPQDIDSFPMSGRGACGGGTGYCTRGRCLCSDICEGMCQWYECGKC